MSKLYLMHEDGRTEPMMRWDSKNEALELQGILERNHDLLPGDQFDPENPRRWLLVRREMPVPDPKTATNRWSLDFLFLDQDAIPTFVECKRFLDPDSRRKVVAQMLEYVANGSHYWTKQTLRKFAEESALLSNTGIDQVLARLQPTDGPSADTFFETARENLVQGRLRMVFFVDQIPRELRSLVDFLHKQFKEVDVFVVEARQYQGDDQRIVAPVLSGFSEEVYRPKRDDEQKAGIERRQWDLPRFLEDARRRLSSSEVSALQDLHDLAVSLDCELSWGSGKGRGSFSIKDPSLCARSLITAYSNGAISLNFGWLNESLTEQSIRDRLAAAVNEQLGISLPADYAAKWFGISMAEWYPKRAQLAEVIRTVLGEFRVAAD